MKYISSQLSKVKNLFTNKVFPYAKTHKIIAAIAVLVILIGGYVSAKAVFGKSGETQYILARVTRGNIETTIAGTGQVAATNQIDIKAKVSGDITYIGAKAGQTMKAGDVIARINTSDISISLQSARLSLQKLTTVDQTSLTQSQNSLASAQQSKADAESSVLKAYESAKISLSTAYLDVPDVVASMNDLFYDETGFLNDRNTAINNGNTKSYRDDAGVSFDTAKVSIESAQNTFRMNTQTTDQDKIEAMIDETYASVSKVADALKKTKIAVDRVKDSLTTGQNTTAANTAVSNVASWTSKVNSHLSDLLSAKSAIASAKNNVTAADRTIAERKNGLTDTLNGSDALDIRSQQLNVQQKEMEYAKYTIRAPFDGILASLNVKKGDEAGSATIGTFITKQKIAEITLNEIDAANVLVGQPATITFDAIDGLVATGTVANIDLVGTVTQGVVNYTAQIAFDVEDPRIKPGMSVSATIITSSKKDVLIVPSAAVKTRAGSSYVEVATMNAGGIGVRNASSAGAGNGNRMRNASSTASSTFTGRTFQSQTAVSLPTPPVQVTVEVGATNNTQTEIISGLTEGQFVVSKIVTSTSTAKTAAPAGRGLFGGGATRGAAGGAGATRAFTR
ncbi:MAG: HlyD family efflux transporter periplasmic adaptor subunit [Patescibacteria group bacterium]